MNIGDGGREGGRALVGGGRILFLLYGALQEHQHSVVTSHPEPGIEPPGATDTVSKAVVFEF